eukprot:2619685-Prymnesium_polylepis.1
MALDTHHHSDTRNSHNRCSGRHLGSRHQPIPFCGISLSVRATTAGPAGCLHITLYGGLLNDSSVRPPPRFPETGAPRESVTYTPRVELHPSRKASTDT